MPIDKNIVDLSKFNPNAFYPFDLRPQDFQMAMQDVYDFLHDVNSFLSGKGLRRLEDMLAAAAMSGFLSEMLTASLGKHARGLTDNLYPNGHPDLIVHGVYPGNAIKAGSEGVEIKSTVKRSGAVDTHGGRDQWMCVFVYRVDKTTEPISDRRALEFTKIFLGSVTTGDFRRNERGPLGTRTSTLHRGGLTKLRDNWIYMF